MPSFEDIQATVLRHLPRPAANSAWSVSTDGIQIVEPGVSIGDLSRLLADLSDSDDLLPEGMPVSDLGLTTLSLARDAVNGWQLDFTIGWQKGASLSLADRFPLRLAKAEFSMRSGGWLRASGKAELAIDDYLLDVDFELPSQVIEVRLDPQLLPDGTAAFLASRGLAGDHPGLKIHHLVVRGSLLLRHLLVHVELEDVFRIGPITLASAMAEVSLAEGTGSSAQADAKLRIALGGQHPDLQIEVQGEADHHGWRLAGALESVPGSLKIADLVQVFGGHFKQPTPALPGPLSKLSLVRLALAVDTHDQSFSIDCVLDWAHDAEVVVHLRKQGDQLLVSGSLTLADVVFKLSFEKSATTVLLGSFEAAGSKGLTLDQVLGALSANKGNPLGAPDIPLSIRGLAVAVDGNGELMLAAAVDAGIDLSRLGELPLIGSLLPRSEPLGLSITPYYLAGGFDPKTAARLPGLMPSTISLSGPLQSGPHLSASLHLGGDPIALDGLTGDDSPRGATPPTTPAKPLAASPALQAEMTWQKVDKTLGPLKIGRIGHAIEKQVIDLVFDASIDLAGLTVSVDGLGARYDAKSKRLTPRLAGLGLDLKQGPLEIGGAFLNADGDFLGKVVISAEKFSLNAIGAFMMLEGTPSMFAYGVLDMPIGGPAFFFVEGLAAGFGLHRQIRMPQIADVRSFPLVAAAGIKSVGEAKPQDELTKLHDYVTPKFGEYFFAAGIKFNSFRLLHGFTVLVVSVGRDFEIDLIGTADFASPPDLPANVPALARIELDLLARFVPAQGLIAVEANLNPKSYVYGPLCHLSGGFAFYAWTSGRHGGDFVLSVGGYHPLYKVPAHYPTVARIELKFQVTPEVYLKGDAYFALTPSMMMAGGGLHADVKSGSLHAWADLSVDFWVHWQPFHYDATLHIGIGAQWKCFHTSASADMHLWGPDFSGTASVDWFVFSFDVAFGPQSPAAPLPIPVAEFKQKFLDIDAAKPDSADATLGIMVGAGLISELNGIPVVAPADLVISCSSRIPVLSCAMNADADGTLDAPIGAKFPAAAMGIPSAGIAALGSSHHEISVTIASLDATGAVVQNPVSKSFRVSPIKAAFPAALWAPGLQVDADSLPIESVNGFELIPAEEPKPGQSQSLQVKDIQYQMSANMLTRTMTLFGTAGPPPTTLPRKDLQHLGLDATSWVDWQAGGRPQIALGGGPMESINA